MTAASGFWASMPSTRPNSDEASSSSPAAWNWPALAINSAFLSTARTINASSMY